MDTGLLMILGTIVTMAIVAAALAYFDKSNH